MKINSFKCPKCGDFTRHIEISSREAAAVWGDDDAIEVAGNLAAGLFGDLLGVRHITRSISGYVPYKCCKCGRCAWRNAAGEDKSFIGYSH